MTWLRVEIFDFLSLLSFLLILASRPWAQQDAVLVPDISAAGRVLEVDRGDLALQSMLRGGDGAALKHNGAACCAMGTE